MSDEKLLEVVDLQAGYNGMAVVHDVSFSVREGEILAILGSNGSGKTPPSGPLQVLSSP